MNIEPETFLTIIDQVANSSLVADRTAHLYLWTRRGAARHSKMLGTDNAWDVFDSLEENYFNPPTAPAIPQSLPEALSKRNTEYQRNSKDEVALSNLVIAADVDGGNAEALSEALHTGISDLKDLLVEVLNDALDDGSEETNG
ncbi:MAG: hypothetical protein LKK48_05400 [Schleiferilactobacillus perolens]|nr:hypothetical protein [Schleiferilactobacillus perolens]MCI2170988.1 hypothetical protein [Schleiferilactobacillus perolens]